MKFLVDECTGPGVTRWLASEGHDVYSVFDWARGLDDGEVIKTAAAGSYIIVTNDKDFGDMVYRERRSHSGVVLLRLRDESEPAKIAALTRAIQALGDALGGSFTVVTEDLIRTARV